jgi:hypothetical protein
MEIAAVIFAFTLENRFLKDVEPFEFTLSLTKNLTRKIIWSTSLTLQDPWNSI